MWHDMIAVAWIVLAFCVALVSVAGLAWFIIPR